MPKKVEESENEDDLVCCDECTHMNYEEDCDNSESAFYLDWVGNTVRYCKCYENKKGTK